MAGFVQYMFKVPTLPRRVWDTLKAICRAEQVSPRFVVIAGVLALIKLRALNREAFLEVWAAAREHAPNDPGFVE